MKWVNPMRPSGIARRPRAGLALCGGGIRSATFTLGALEALAAKDVLGALTASRRSG
jgi:predicted acylesterase/phospholipase RssA